MRLKEEKMIDLSPANFRASHEEKKEITEEKVKKDELPEYEFQGDPDAVIEEMQSRRNEWETDILFTKNGLIKYIDDMLEFERSGLTEELWVSQLKSFDRAKNPTIEVLVKTGGSAFSKDHPYFLLDMTCNSCLNFDQVAKAYFTRDHRLKWDSNNI